MIFNISGTPFSSSNATAEAGDIVSGKIAFTASGKTTGTGALVPSFTDIPSTNCGDFILVGNKTYVWDNTSNKYIIIFSTDAHLSYISAEPVKSAYAFGEEITATVIAYYDNGSNIDISNLATFSPSTASSEEILVSYTEDNATVTTTMDISIIPLSSNYTGTSRISNEGYGRWSMECFTSGTFSPPTDCLVDIHLVGGGGSGAVGTWTDYYNQEFGGGGGGGGYTHSYGPIQLYSGVSYPIVVGSGGTAPSTAATNGANGGNSSAFLYSVNGGGGGGYGDNTDYKTYGRGGNGGSAGGAGSIYGKSGVSAGGEHGMSTENSRINDSIINHGGIGQDRDTYDWFDLDEKTTTILRAGGGGASGGNGNSTTGEHGSLGGHGGGGHGASSQYAYNATSGMNHKGGGGGGGLYRSSSTFFQAGNGGSGIVLIRTHRNNKVDYYYTGNSFLIQDSETEWTLLLNSNGVLTLNKDLVVDLYLLGGGQSGYRGTSTTYGGYNGNFFPGAAGGQGGFIKIVSNVALSAGSYPVTIGYGGSDGNGGAGGTSSFGTLYDAPGGGSGATGYIGGAAGGIAGELNGTNTPKAGGAGGDSVVADFLGIYRGGGGGGGYSARVNNATDAWSYNWAPNSGGEEGGARSMVNSSGGGRNATANYGGGGSGGLNGDGGAGGSGIIIVRTHR